jgi:signal transduction histidine kinase/CheY-like chemotaxis protein
MNGKSGLEIGDISELMQQLGAIVWESFAGKWSVTFVSHHIQRSLSLPDQWNRDLTTWIELLHPEDRDRVIKLIVSAMSGERPVVFDDRVRRADGGWLWLRNIVRHQRNAAGESGLQAFGFDITELKEAQVALEEAHRRDTFLAEATRVLAGDLDYEATLANIVGMAVPRIADWCAVRVNGEPPIHIVSDGATMEKYRDLFRSFAPDDRIGPRKVLRTGDAEFMPDEAAMAQAAAPNPGYFEATRQFGFKSYVCVPLRGRDEIMGALSLAFTDSGRRYTQADLLLAQNLAGRAAVAIENARLFETRRALAESEHAARTAAEEASRLKDEFLATLSHELRAPLTAIVGWTHLLQRGSPGGDEGLRQGLAVIDRNIKLLLQLIDDLLDMSRIVAGKLRLDVQTVDLAEVIANAVAAVQPAADAKGVTLHSILDPLAGPMRGDFNRLQQIVWNLLSNAVKFTPKGGHVQVSLALVNSHVEIGVADTGQGIEPEFLPYVFERFRQADASTTRRHSGLGLGLAIVKHLTELHGGSVSVKSPGRAMGTAFVVELPLMVVHAAAGEAARRHPRFGAEAQRPDFPPLDGIRVLAVDDEPDARDIIKRALESCGAVVDTAASAAEGLELFQRGGYDVILSDIGMPEEDGFAFIGKVRELERQDNSRTPAAAFTAFARSDDRIRVLRAGYQMHLAKPVEPVELAAAVASLAESNTRRP